MKKLLVPLLALGLALGAESSFADRDGYDDRRGNDRGYDRDWRGNNGNGWGRRESQGRWKDRDNRHDRRDTDLSISLSFGNIVRGSHGAPLIRHNDNFGISPWSSYRPSWSAPRIISRPRTPVVIYENNYNIITRPITRPGSVTGRVPGYAGSSLLRDVQGRCFERDYDSRGRETRTELPASACRF